MFRERARMLQAASVILDGACICLSFFLALSLKVYHEQLPFLSALPPKPWSSEIVVRSDCALLPAVSTAWGPGAD